MHWMDGEREVNDSEGRAQTPLLWEVYELIG